MAGYKIADSSDPSLVFATGNKEECAQQLPNTVGSIGQQENTYTGASEQTATVATLATPSVRGLHVEKIADSSDNFHVFATGNEEQCLQQPSDTVCTTEQLVHARAGASELVATSADKFTLSAGGSQVAKIADGSVILQTFAISSEEECPPQLPSTFGAGGQRRNARTAASEQAATSANSYASTIRGLQVAEVGANHAGQLL